MATSTLYTTLSNIVETFYWDSVLKFYIAELRTYRRYEGVDEHLH